MKKSLLPLIGLALALVAGFSLSCNSVPADKPKDEAKAAAKPVDPNAPVENEAVLADGSVCFENFEEDPAWIAVASTWNDGDCSIACNQSGENPGNGKSSLQCAYKLTGKKEATFAADGVSFSDWSGTKAIKLDIFVGGETDLLFSFVVNTGNSWNWYESKKVSLTPGMHKDFTIDMSKDWMCAQVADKVYDKGVAELESVKRVAVRFDGPAGTSGKSYIDFIRLVK